MTSYVLHGNNDKIDIDPKWFPRLEHDCTAVRNVTAIKIERPVAQRTRDNRALPDHHEVMKVLHYTKVPGF